MAFFLTDALLSKIRTYIEIQSQSNVSSFLLSLRRTKLQLNTNVSVVNVPPLSPNKRW
jgi:hypothetical protein